MKETLQRAMHHLVSGNAAHGVIQYPLQDSNPHLLVVRTASCVHLYGGEANLIALLCAGQLARVLFHVTHVRQYVETVTPFMAIFPVAIASMKPHES